MLDTGTIGIGNTTQNVCPYALNVFDLATDRRIRRYEFNAEDTNPNTFIANIAIDIGKNCEDSYAYFSDELGYGLVSYSWEQNKSWRFAHSFFFPDPLRGDYNIAGLNFQWGEEGIFGMALSALKADGFRTLYFSPLASHREFSVSTQILRDSTRLEESFHDFSYFEEERAGNAHTTSRVMSETGVMLFNLIDQNAVGCWDSSTPYSPKNHGIVDRDDETLVFPADVKIDETNTVWVISDRMPVFLIAELDYTDINFRIFSASLENLIQGTVCSVRQPFPNRFNPVSALPIVTNQPQQYNYNDYSTENLGTSAESLSSGYTGSTKLLGYTAPISQRPITQLPTTPKAFVYNQHNGVTLKTETPAFYNYFPLKQNQGSYNYQKPRSQPENYQTNFNNNKWSTHQYYY